ncbi:hypothetical protein SESBI_45945 [Sesbania bispinosa]|nr:hypothetical protein SESBI_45945 [Sesbania bispinosa]
MPKVKNTSMNSTQQTREKLRWNDEMDVALLHAFCEQAAKGNKNDGSWNTEAYTFVANPNAAKFKDAQIKHYDIMKKLFGADRATGKHDMTAKEKMKQWEKEKDCIDLNENFEDFGMNEPDVSMFDEIPITLPNVEAFSPVDVPSHHSTETSMSRGTKHTASIADVIESQYEKVSLGINALSEALKDGNYLSGWLHEVAERQVAVTERQVAIAEKQDVFIQKQIEIAEKGLTIMQHNRQRIYSEGDVWDLLTSLGVIDAYKMKCYHFLCSNDQRRREIFGVPPDMQVEALGDMMREAGIM